MACLAHRQRHFSRSFHIRRHSIRSFWPKPQPGPPIQSNPLGSSLRPQQTVADVKCTTCSGQSSLDCCDYDDDDQHHEGCGFTAATTIAAIRCRTRRGLCRTIGISIGGSSSLDGIHCESSLMVIIWSCGQPAATRNKRQLALLSLCRRHPGCTNL